MYRGGPFRPETCAATARCWKNAVRGRRPILGRDEPSAGEFLVVRELGRGASSVVYLARQRSLDRDVALKRLLRSLSGDPAASARLRREGQVISRLDHPRIVRLYDLIDGRGQTSCSSWSMSAGRASGRLSVATPPSPSQALAVVADVAGALGYAAARDVVHRDVKPANVFVTAAGRCKLGDFGLARITGERAMFQSNDGTVRGTPLYMAPEQLRGAEPTPAWDVYALALMALELFSSRHPFEGMTIRGAIEAHLEGGAVTAAAQASLPRSIVDVLRGGLTSDAAARPTAQEFADSLVRAAPQSWLDEGAPGAALVRATSPTGGRSEWVPTHSEGLWAADGDSGWTVEVVDEATWLGGSDNVLDGLPIAAPLSVTSPDAPTTQPSVARRPPASMLTQTTIDDQWIRHATPDLGKVSTRRTRRMWLIVLAAFVIGFAFAFAAVELLRH